MSSIVFITSGRDPKPFINAIKALDASIKCEIHPDVQDKGAVIGAVAWNHDPAAWKDYLNLKWVSSLGAGVDHLVSDKKLPKHLIISRIVDELLIRDMSRYVLTCVLMAKKRIIDYQSQQQQAKWKALSEHPFEKVGILGAGELGGDAAIKLSTLGFQVATFSQTEKHLEGIKSYYGKEQFNTFLKQSEILINLLPLNDATRHILNVDLFGQLPKGAIIINAARGTHLVEQDLINALDSGQISFAFLDVFQQEPLDKNHAFWNRKDVFITPHVASVTKAANAAKVIAENYNRLIDNKDLLYTVG